MGIGATKVLDCAHKMNLPAYIHYEFENVLLHNMQYDKAIKEYQHVISAKPEFIDAYVQIKLAFKALEQNKSAQEFHMKFTKYIKEFYIKVENLLTSAIEPHLDNQNHVIPNINQLILEYLVDIPQEELYTGSEMLGLVDGM